METASQKIIALSRLAGLRSPVRNKVWEELVATVKKECVQSCPGASEKVQEEAVDRSYYFECAEADLEQYSDIEFYRKA